MSFRASESESRNLPKQQVLSCVGSFSHVVDSSTPLRYGRNDILEGDSVLSAQVILETWRAAGCRPYGYAGGRYRSTAQVVFETWPFIPTLAVSCGFTDWCIFEPTCFKTGTSLVPIIVNCPLSIVNFKKTTASFSRSGYLVLALPIFPASHPASIVGADELNFCVRDGNRWTLVAINTN